MNHRLLRSWITLCLFALLGQAAEGPGPNTSIESILPELNRYVSEGMQKTQVPGVAIGIVHRNKVVYLKGFGIRRVGESQPVDAQTVFQLASVSKSIASTLVAALVGDGLVGWDDRIRDLDPGFRLSNAEVSEQVTVRDMLSHRSGLPERAGDNLEDLGFTRPEILHQIRLLPLTGQFRQTYAYSNFPYTEGALAAARPSGRRWEDLAERRLFRRAGMLSTSYRYSDYQNRQNKAASHVFVNDQPVPRYQRDADAEAPAGGASSNVHDMARWLQLQLANGTLDGDSIVAARPLSETHSPQIVRGPEAKNFYGLGWDVDYDAQNRLILSHSGAFRLGTGTTVRMMPSEQLGIVVLTNANPVGLAEAIALTFFDLYLYGKPQQDWLSLAGDVYRKLTEDLDNSSKDYSKLTPPSPVPAQPLSGYAGTYRNPYYGTVEITNNNGLLEMRLPARGQLYALQPWDTDTFVYRFEVEGGIGTRGVQFNYQGSSDMRIENFALEGSGVFTKETK
jgi:CubicO group peptidase (beta-lactamase class C family)